MGQSCFYQILHKHIEGNMCWLQIIDNVKNNSSLNMFIFISNDMKENCKHLLKLMFFKSLNIGIVNNINTLRFGKLINTRFKVTLILLYFL